MSRLHLHNIPVNELTEEELCVEFIRMTDCAGNYYDPEPGAWELFSGLEKAQRKRARLKDILKRLVNE